MHNIQYYSYDENVDRAKVQKELDHYVAMEDWQEGCTGLDKPIRWIENAGVYSDWEAAQKAIEKFDRGWYDQLAVRYYEHNGIDKKKVKWLVKIEYHT